MKRIIMSEAQFQRLMEITNGDAPTFDSNVKEYQGSEVFATTNVTDMEGNPEFGDPQMTDKFSQSLSPQSYWNSRNRRRIMP